LGDIVEIIKTRPISKRKHWKVTKVLGKDVVALGTQALKEEAAEAIAEVLPEELAEEAEEERGTTQNLNAEQAQKEEAGSTDVKSAKKAKVEKVEAKSGTSTKAKVSEEVAEEKPKKASARKKKGEA
jgi:hypothetical protein